MHPFVFDTFSDLTHKPLNQIIWFFSCFVKSFVEVYLKIYYIRGLFYWLGVLSVMSDNAEFVSDEFVSDEFDTIEVYDDEGGSEKFELLDTVELNGVKYMIIAPLDDEEEAEDEVEDVYIAMVTTSNDGQEVLEIIADEALVDKVFAEFKKRKSSEFDFV
jgi:hypothetical protein